MKVIFFVIRKRHLKLFLLLLLVLLGGVLHKPVGRLVFPFPFREEIERRAEYAGVDPQLVAALIYVESKFNPKARSTKGARGLMQIMPETAAWVSAQKGLDLQEEDLDRPEVNIPIGVWYLSYLFREFNGDRVLALAAYNAGGEKVKAWLASGAWSGRVNDLHSIPYLETRRYVAKIMRTYCVYRYLYNHRA
ncbi:lytic transglycosylase domain-containing protein [Capillibacterium thermochitinicola]|uniref:lytic transglycosylase domain-containing protein n=1 Tax=Capillibacterium thermochitinicola TaxID=2699427 RepID=UPI002F2B69DF